MSSINSLEGIESGLKSFLKLGIVEVLIQDNSIQIPFNNWLQGEKRTFEVTDSGLLLR